MARTADVGSVIQSTHLLRQRTDKFPLKNWCLQMLQSRQNVCEIKQNTISKILEGTSPSRAEPVPNRLDITNRPFCAFWPKYHTQGFCSPAGGWNWLVGGQLAWITIPYLRAKSLVRLGGGSLPVPPLLGPGLLPWGSKAAKPIPLGRAIPLPTALGTSPLLVLSVPLQLIGKSVEVVTRCPRIVLLFRRNRP